MTTQARLEKLAETHRLEFLADYEVGAYTPSLWRTTAPAAAGPLTDGLTGTLALPARRGGGDGEGGASALPVVLVHLPTTISCLPDLRCHDASWRLTREYELAASGFKRLDHETIFESSAVERRFAIEHPEGTDPIFLRRLFSPTFLDWLGDAAPRGLYFELLDGRLTVILGEGDDLETLWVAAGRIAERLDSEASEGSVPVVAGFAAPLPSPPEPDEAARTALAKVDWSEPPLSTLAAADALEEHVGGAGGRLARAFFLAGGIALVPLLLAAADWFVFGGVVTTAGLIGLSLVLFWTIFPMAVRGPHKRQAGEWGKLAFAEGVARAERLTQEDPAALHERWPALQLPGPARRVWRGTAANGRTFRLLLMSDRSGTPGSSGFEGLLVEAAGDEPGAPAGPDVERLESEGLLLLYRTTPLPSGPTLAGLQQLRAAV